jgi:hypothetical protein
MRQLLWVALIGSTALAGCAAEPGKEKIDNDDGSTASAGAAGSAGATTSTGSSDPSTTSASSGTGGAPPVVCEWPAAPYGKLEGQTPSPKVKWKGYAEGSSEYLPLELASYFDCDGSKGINAVLFITAQYG